MIRVQRSRIAERNGVRGPLLLLSALVLIGSPSWAASAKPSVKASALLPSGKATPPAKAGPSPGKPSSATQKPYVGADGSVVNYPFARTRPEQIPIPPFRFTVPEPRKEVLPNGLTIYYLEDHRLPLFSIAAYTRYGAIYDPATQASLAGILAEVMRTGGAGDRTGDALDEALEFVGARLEGSAGREYTTFSGDSLMKDSDLLLGALSDVLRRPAFGADKLELARSQGLEGIRRRNDDPQAIASREFPRLVYGRESPYALIASPASVKGITRNDLLATHRRYFLPNNTILAVSGDFKAESMLDQLRRAFGDWPKGDLNLPKFDPVKDVDVKRVYVIQRPLPQATMIMGHVGRRRNEPDSPAVDVMNEILGTSGFTSRLMREVRSNRGLAYGAWGQVGPGPDRGLFQMGAQTKTESAIQAANLMAQVAEGMRDKPITPQEVKLAKDGILNSYVFDFDTPDKVVNERARMDMLGYPPDWFRTHASRVQAVTVADVEAAAKKHLHPDKMVYLFVGDANSWKAGLAALGPVEPLTLDPVDDAPSLPKAPTTETGTP